jgi:hypothetical protein
MRVPVEILKKVDELEAAKLLGEATADAYGCGI